MSPNDWYTSYYGQLLNYGCTIKEEPKKPMLKQIPNTLKRAISPKLQKLYKAGLINGELALTDKGKTELLEILSEEYRDKLVDVADEIIKEAGK